MIDQHLTWPGFYFLAPPPYSKEAVSYTQRISDVFQDNYSGMTCSLLILNAPWVFTKGWQVIESEKPNRSGQNRRGQEQIRAIIYFVLPFDDAHFARMLNNTTANSVLSILLEASLGRSSVLRFRVASECSRCSSCMHVLPKRYFYCTDQRGLVGRNLPKARHDLRSVCSCWRTPCLL